MGQTMTYVSGSDSELLRKASAQYKGRACLEIGVGYGSNLIEARKNFELAVGTDCFRTEAFKRKNEVEWILADCASCFAEESFDFIMLNPPYLPSKNFEDNSVDGGKGGFQVAARFLSDAIRVLKQSGIILILLSTETSIDEFRTFCQKNKLVSRVVKSSHLFFEDIFVFEVSKEK